MPCVTRHYFITIIELIVKATLDLLRTDGEKNKGSVFVMEHASLLGKGPLIKKKKSKCRGIGVFREWVRLRKTSNDITKKQKA